MLQLTAQNLILRETFLIIVARALTPGSTRSNALRLKIEDEERKWGSPKDASPPDGQDKVRVSTGLDLNPPVFYGVFGALSIVAAVLFFSSHPALFANFQRAIASAFIRSNQEHTQRQEAITRELQPKSGPESASGQAGPEGELERQKVLTPSTDKTEIRLAQEGERLRALQERETAERHQAEERLSAEQEARKNAEARAKAEGDALENAKQAATLERIAREEAEKAARERDARQRAESELARIKTSQSNPLLAYTGPRFGTIVWQGEVHGTELITIENDRASSGTITGRLPGVPVLIQPVNNNKKVGIASSPSPGNSYRSMVFRISGNGPAQQSFQWSLP